MDYRRNRIKKILKKLKSMSEIKAAAVVSSEGLPIISYLPTSINEIKISAITATLLSLAEKCVIEMKRGIFEQLVIRGSDGYFIVQQAGNYVVLAVNTTNDAKLGLLFLECNRACEKIADCY